MSILSATTLEFVLRWLHFFFGVMWIGHLYYFNMTQMNIMPKADAATKAGITRVLLPEAMYWFRWGAMWTMVTGVLYLGHKYHQVPEFFSSSYGLAIGVGASFGLIMWANVWFLIWPKQKIVIASAEQVANGGTAIPSAAESAARARVVSRTNTMFSIPMLFFMGAASHMPLPVTPESKTGLFWGAFLVILAALQLNGMKGKEGPIQTLKGVLSCGFALALALFAILQICL